MTPESRAIAVDELTLWHGELETEFARIHPKCSTHNGEGVDCQRRAAAWRDADEAIRHTQSVLDQLKSALRSRPSNGHAHRGRKVYEVKRRPTAKAS